MKTVFTVFSLMLLISSVAFAGKETLDIDKKKVAIEVPEKWQAVKDLYGMPYMLMGPMRDDGRPVMSLTRTMVTEEKISRADFEGAFDETKNDKLKWLQTHKGQLLTWDDPTKVDFGKVKGHYIGSEFMVQSIHYIERSYYLYCGGEVLNVKYQTREELRDTVPQMQEIARSIACE